MFDNYPTYNRYRSLKRQSPMLIGEDVYALQTGLTELGFDTKGADGYLGDNTAKQILAFQASRKLFQDGVAGQTTQRRICVDLITRATKKYDLPHLLLYGQIEHESSFILGNYSAQYSDGSYDAGVVQRNTNFTIPQDGFNTGLSVDACGSHCAQYYDKFLVNLDLTEERRWGLAAGAWNAPYYASYLANVKPWAVPTQDDVDKLEAYIQSVTKYMEL